MNRSISFGDNEFAGVNLLYKGRGDDDVLLRKERITLMIGIRELSSKKRGIALLFWVNGIECEAFESYSLFLSGKVG